MNRSTTTTARTIDLAEGQLLCLAGPAGCIRLMHGKLWLTESDELRDAVLSAGDGWCLAGRPLLLGAIEPTRLQLNGPAPGLRSRLAARWLGARLTLRCWVRRLQLGPVGVGP